MRSSMPQLRWNQQVRGQLGGNIDNGGAVSTTDDADSTGFLVGEAQHLSANEGKEDAQLSSSAQQQAEDAISGLKSAAVPMPWKISGDRYSADAQVTRRPCRRKNPAAPSQCGLSH